MFGHAACQLLHVLSVSMACMSNEVLQITFPTMMDAVLSGHWYHQDNYELVPALDQMLVSSK